MPQLCTKAKAGKIRSCGVNMHSLLVTFIYSTLIVFCPAIASTKYQEECNKENIPITECTPEKAKMIMYSEKHKNIPVHQLYELSIALATLNEAREHVQISSAHFYKLLEGQAQKHGFVELLSVLEEVTQTEYFNSFYQTSLTAVKEQNYPPEYWQPLKGN